jgi:type II secretory pathway pseudopilin PulG
MPLKWYFNDMHAPQNRGLTLIEILVSMGILILIIGLGMVVSLDFFRSSSFQSEQEVIVSALQKARSESMNNIDQMRHGVRLTNSQYIIFECSGSCTTYPGSASSDIILKPDYPITFTPAPADVVFDQLSGDCVGCTPSDIDIHANDGTKNFTINVNSEGRINW